MALATSGGELIPVSAIGPCLAGKSDQIFEAVRVDDAVTPKALKPRAQRQRLLRLGIGCEWADDDPALVAAPYIVDGPPVDCPAVRLPQRQPEERGRVRIGHELRQVERHARIAAMVHAEEQL